ncbi:amidohydrolase family protein [Mobilicoccus caccae]
MRFGVISHSVFFYAEYDSYETSLGEEQFAIAYPLRTMYENLPDVAIASDSPATAWADCDNPFISVMAAVCRRAYNGADINQAEAISVGQALELYTGRAARITGNRGVGLVAPGYEGNFVVLDRDVFTIEESTIDQTRVMRTYLRGELAFSR